MTQATWRPRSHQLCMQHEAESTKTLGHPCQLGLIWTHQVPLRGRRLYKGRRSQLYRPVTLLGFLGSTHTSRMAPFAMHM